MEALSYKCPNCGGDLKFNPQGRGYKCDYCSSEYSQEELNQIFADNESAALREAAQNESVEDVNTSDEEVGRQQALLYSCPSCGAQIVTDFTTAATFCYYCHSPVVLSGRLDGADTPDYVIPFEIDKAGAEVAFAAWIKKKRYVPKSFYSKDQIDKLSGVYFPYLLYSCKVHASLDATAEKHSRNRIGNTEYQHIDSYHIKKEGDMDLNNIARNALKKANKALVEAVLPYDFNQGRQFKLSCLSGFMAERKDMQTADFSENIKAEVSTYAMSRLADYLADYSNITVYNKEVAVTSGNWQYALLPVWTLTYKDDKNNKVYYFSLNGQNGKVVGELPVDYSKLMLTFALIALPLIILMLLASYFVL